MSKAKLAIFFLRLISLGAVLFTAIAILEALRGFPAMKMFGFEPPPLPSGCMVVATIIVLIPLSLVPAFAGWMIQKHVVLPREIAERRRREEAFSREDRLRAWMTYTADLLLRHRALRNLPGDPMPGLVRTEIARAFRELDTERWERFRAFLREVGLGPELEEVSPPVAAFAPMGQPTVASPKHGCVRLAAATLALMSFFLLLFTGLGFMTQLKFKPYAALGIVPGPAETLLGLWGCWVPAIVLGLAATGLLRMWRQMLRSLQERETERQSVRDLALKSALDQIDILARWMEVEGAGSDVLVQRIARAAVLTAMPELDGVCRGKLIRALFEMKWLTAGKLSLAGVDLQGTELAGASLPGICLAGTDLSGADLNGVDFGRADLQGCFFQRSDLRSARLTAANFRGADLRHVRLQKAALEGANLRDVLLDGANFWGAGLSGADLTGAQGTAEFLVLPTN
ncbi:MAG TPA: pentapeptide repeat-containing protein [Thermoanaerobaculia bacterium]|jgi:uncharacterized protein YjbI with pentapeptide repeats|nr:pentapeptide repeat-containing protein [Thermoanaerobaculia bacterium]